MDPDPRKDARMLSIKEPIGQTLSTRPPALETSDIQATVLRPRPKPYCGEYVILRIGNAEQGREMLRRILPYVAPADEWWMPSLPGWLGIAFTFEGLKALGVPPASLDSFPIEFRQGMAARAAILHDFGANAPANWEYPFGTPDAHVALAIYAKSNQDLQKVLESHARVITTSRKSRSCTACRWRAAGRTQSIRLQGWTAQSSCRRKRSDWPCW
jgi:deferrochelatase/peroxidase EfeB